MLTPPVSSDIGAFNYQAIGHTVFAVGRFLSALAGLLFEPRLILMFLYICLIITSTLAMNLTGHAGVAMIVLILFFEVYLPCLLNYPTYNCLSTAVGRLLNHFRNVSTRSRLSNEAGVGGADSSNIWWRRDPSHHGTSQPYKWDPVWVLRSGGGLCIWIAFAALRDVCPCCATTS